MLWLAREFGGTAFLNDWSAATRVVSATCKAEFGGGRGRFHVVGAASFRLLYPVFSSLQPAASPAGNGEGLPIQRNVSLIRSRPQSAHTMELSIDRRLSRAVAGSEHLLVRNRGILDT